MRGAGEEKREKKFDASLLETHHLYQEGLAAVAAVKKFPYVSERETQDYHLIFLSPDHYVFVEKDAEFSPVIRTHEFVYDASHQVYIPVENSPFSLAKPLRSGSKKAERELVAETNAVIGIATKQNPIKLGDTYYVFLKNIDAGINLEDAAKMSENSVLSLLTCLKQAMQDALHICKAALIVHLDIKLDNIMFPSGTCIDYEYCLHLPTEDSVYGTLPSALKITKKNIKEFLKEANIPAKMYAINANDEIILNKRVMDYSFHSVIARLIESFGMRELSTIEKETVKKLSDLETGLEEGDALLEDAIVTLNSLIQALTEKKEEKLLSAKTTFFGVSLFQEETKILASTDNPDFNRFIKLLENIMTTTSAKKLLGMREQAHSLKEKLLHQIEERKEIKSQKKLSEDKSNPLTAEHISFLDHVIRKIESKISTTMYIPPLVSHHPSKIRPH